MDLGLKGCVALVTGGTRGIGRAVADILVDEGAIVEVRGSADGDLAQPEIAEQIVQAVVDRHGRLDVLVHAAGIIGYEEGWDRTLAVDLTAARNVLHPATRHMKGRSFGRVVTLSSISAKLCVPDGLAYCAAKAGVIALVRAYATELAPFGVLVNDVAPGLTRTEMAQQVVDRAGDVAISRIPLGRMAEPEEIARLVVFLASPANGFVTGESVNANGGRYMD